jgi:leucyl aminopeptidase
MTLALVVVYGSDKYAELDKKLKHKLEEACDRAGLLEKEEGSVELSYVHDQFDFITVVKTKAATPKEWRELGGTHYKKYAESVDEVTLSVGNTDLARANAYEGARLAAYRFNKYKTVEKKKAAAIVLDAENVPTTADVIHESVYFARDLISEPGNVLFPEEYAQRIYETLTPLGVTVKIIPQKMLERMGFDLLLSVGQGSTKDSHVVVMEWKNGKDKPVKALVGKGVTFDTGGISIKPSAGMGDMKYDMGGSAAVVGAMHAIASHKLKENVVGIVGLVENMPDGNSIKPGDIVTSLSGMTVENLNTDAEGRLVLADILTYVQREYDPRLVVDLATLTGAIVVSLAEEAAGLFTNSSELANTIDAVGSAQGENYWRMPMGKNWNKMIDSEIADVKNIGGGKGGGSTTAAEFLYRFVDSNRAWAHLDIAGVCWDTKGKATVPAGAVGFGVRTLYKLVQEDCARFEIDEDMNY